MRRGERARDLHSEPDRLLQRQIAPQEATRQCLAFHQFHHQAGRSDVVLHISPQTVMRDWKIARAWLTARIG
jgi:hypothetical protein